MAGGFHDLVLSAQPAIASDGCTATATEGMTWEWDFDPTLDNAGTPIDLSAVTGTCTVYDSVGGSVVTTLTFTGAADGTFKLYKDEATTTGLAAGSNKRVCYWSLILTNGTDTVAAWAAQPESKFIIRKA